MNRFIDFDEYKDWMRETSSEQKAHSNCFLMPDMIRDLIREQKLFGAELPDGRALYSDEEDFYRIYYFLNAAVCSKLPVADKPVVAELVFGHSLLPSQLEQIESLETMGFRLGRESQRMILPAADCPAPETAEGVIYAGADDIPDCKALFREHFNPLYAFIPNDREWEIAIKNRTVFCIYEENRLAGALFSQVNKNSAELRLLCVNEAYRGKGYAKKLLSFYHAVWIDQVKQFAHWVDSANSAAISLYRSFGYQFDIRRSREYIFTEKEA